MATKRTTNSETRKNAATTTPTARNPPVRASITVQKPPGPQRDAKTPPTSTDAGVKNFHHDITASSIETPPTKQPTEAEQLMFQGLSQLQEIHDASKIDKITMERTTFQAIARTFQKAYEQIKTNPSTPAPTTTPLPALGDSNILDALQQIKTSIINLEAMQTRNVLKTDASVKTYMDAIKIPITAAQLHKHQEQQRIRAQRIQSTIILNTIETSDKIQQ